MPTIEKSTERIPGGTELIAGNDTEALVTEEKGKQVAGKSGWLAIYC